MKGTPFLDIVEADRRSSVKDILERAMEGNQTANYELPLLTKDGMWCHLLVNATTQRKADGRVKGVIGIAHDITDQKRGENEIKSLLAEAKLLIETANAPIFGVDHSLNITEWNKKAEEITGYGAEETKGKPLLSFIEERRGSSVKDVLERALQGDQTANYELRLLTKDGRRRDLLLNATAQST